jgi:hypothetical protein
VPALPAGLTGYIPETQPDNLQITVMDFEIDAEVYFCHN